MQKASAWKILLLEYDDYWCILTAMHVVIKSNQHFFPFTECVVKFIVLFQIWETADPCQFTVYDCILLIFYRKWQCGITRVSIFAAYDCFLYVRMAESELWWCGGSQRSKDCRSDLPEQNWTKEGDKPNGWITSSPRQHHCSDIQGWRMVCMCEFACCMCMHMVVRDQKKKTRRRDNTVHLWLFSLAHIICGRANLCLM